MVHDSQPPTPSPGMVYGTYDFYLLIKYQYRIDIAIFSQYRIDSKNQYRCITNTHTRPLWGPTLCIFTVPEQSRIRGELATSLGDAFWTSVAWCVRTLRTSVILPLLFTCQRWLIISFCSRSVDCWYQDGRVMMLEPVGEEDEADLLRQDDDEANQSGRLFTVIIIITIIIICFSGRGQLPC